MSYNIDNIIDIVSLGLINNTNQRDPCSLCNKRVKCNQHAIKCTLCDKWVHIKCNGTSKKDYENSKNQDASWSCLLCIIQDNLTNMPFTRCGNKELKNINNSNTMAFTESLPDKEMVNETIKFSNVTGNVAMEELSSKTCCKYYSVEEYQKLPENNNMNIFHTNIMDLNPNLITYINLFLVANLNWIS